MNYMAMAYGIAVLALSVASYEIFRRYGKTEAGKDEPDYSPHDIKVHRRVLLLAVLSFASFMIFLLLPREYGMVQMTAGVASLPLLILLLLAIRGYGSTGQYDKDSLRRMMFLWLVGMTFADTFYMAFLIFAGYMLFL